MPEGQDPYSGPGARAECRALLGQELRTVVADAPEDHLLGSIKTSQEHSEEKVRIHTYTTCSASGKLN